MKKLYLLFSLALCVTLTFTSCREEGFDAKDQEPTVMDNKDYSNLQKSFGQALAKALIESKEIRAFLKEQALLMFDKDYDVLYQLVKERPLSNGKSFREALLPYFSSEDQLQDIERKLPLLTIFVPELPEGSFSAHTWNTDDQIPYVALSQKKTNEVPIISDEGEEFVLKGNMIPGFPVVVLKDNERVTVRSFSSSQGANKRSFQTQDNANFEFIDESFDNLNPVAAANNSSKRATLSIDPKLIAARNYGLEWHRDHIYYNMTPTVPKGEFSLDFREYITSFRFINGEQGYTKIADQSGDPRIIGGGPVTGWTDGSFEFRVVALINGKVTKPTLEPMFTAKGSDLFDVEYEKIIIYKCRKPWCWGSDVVAYIPKTITPKTYNPNVPLMKWDLDSYSSSMVIKIEEYDVSENITETHNVSSKFATNFQIEGQIKKKIGFKFGASLEQTTSQTHQRIYTLGSDYLGETIVDFGDKVIIGETSTIIGKIYLTQEYSTGFVAISVEPKRVQ